MEIHGLVALAVRSMLHKARIATLDLNTAASLLLDMLDIRSTMTNNLRSEVESWDGLKVDRNTLFRPFALLNVSNCGFDGVKNHTRPNSSRST